MEYCIILTTCPNGKEAKTLAAKQKILEKEAFSYFPCTLV